MRPVSGLTITGVSNFERRTIIKDNFFEPVLEFQDTLELSQGIFPQEHLHSPHLVLRKLQ